jgi:hypothetical protein
MDSIREIADNRNRDGQLAGTQARDSVTSIGTALPNRHRGAP